LTAELGGILKGRTMKELKEAPRSMLKFEGSPSDVGAQIWERMCNPAVRAVTGRPERELAQLYAGILMAAMGSMAADFGHERATDIVRDLTEAFAGMAGELEGGLTQ
jgi:hypothetical protein